MICFYSFGVLCSVRCVENTHEHTACHNGQLHPSMFSVEAREAREAREAPKRMQ